ncbi:PfkB family carbohydrate kinase [Pelagibacteraceae bacterium]|nr:PfkB family carbohydrate kinase [Pelagibacteraceae bacterium]
MKKILLTSELQKEIQENKKSGKKIVLCHGVFDLLHYGHINHFEQAKSHGDILIVSLTPDQFVNKGPLRPAFEERIRMKALASLQIVDFVYLNNSPSAVEAINKLKPDIYCKGSDYKIHKQDLTKNIKREINAIKKVKGKIIYTGGQTFSSGKLINTFSDDLSPSMKKNINFIKKKYYFDQIKKVVDNFKNLKVLIIGELIIDEYVYCEALGKSGKDPMLVLKDISTEKYIGGSGAIAKNLLSFSKNITLFTALGEKKEQLNFIKKNLKGIKLKYIKKTNSPTIVKKRFLDFNSGSKILGIYTINDNLLSKKNEIEFKQLINTAGKYDVVITSDYGHGLISKQCAKIIYKKSKYLALNAQVNAANIGFHGLKKYRNVHSVIINEKELRHELRDKDSDIKMLIKKLSNFHNFKNLIVTRGTTGAILFDKKSNKFIESDALAKNAVDKIGAGDTMLSLISLCMQSKLDNHLSLLIASIGAAISVKNYANKYTLDKNQILKSLESIIK